MSLPNADYIFASNSFNEYSKVGAQFVCTYLPVFFLYLNLTYLFYFSVYQNQACTCYGDAFVWYTLLMLSSHGHVTNTLYS